jgi:hypothetical protein
VPSGRKLRTLPTLVRVAETARAGTLEQVVFEPTSECSAIA